MCKSKGCSAWIIAKILLIIGGLNWGLYGVGLFFDSNWNLVYLLLGKLPIIESVVYIIVGLSAIAVIFGCSCKKCKSCCQVENPTQAPTQI